MFPGILVGNNLVVAYIAAIAADQPEGARIYYCWQLLAYINVQGAAPDAMGGPCRSADVRNIISMAA